MAQLGILTSEFERPTLAATLDGTVVLHQLRGLSDAEMAECVEYVRRHAPEGFLA